MTQLAERSGLSQSMISFIERGIRKPSLETLVRLCSALKVKVSEVISEAEDVG